MNRKTNDARKANPNNRQAFDPFTRIKRVPGTNQAKPDHLGSGNAKAQAEPIIKAKNHLVCPNLFTSIKGKRLPE